MIRESKDSLFARNKVGNISYDYIENYIRELIPKKSGNILEMRKYAKENHVPIIEEESEEFYKFLLNIKKPKKILELGTAIGYSSIVFAKNTDSIEYIKTIEIREDMVEIAKNNIKIENLESVIEVIHNDAQIALENLDKDEFYDVIFIDAAKGQYEKYFNLALEHLNDDGIILCDNVLFKGMIANQDLVIRRKITIVKRLRKFLKDIENNDKFISSIIPIGDGVLLIKRR